MKATDVSLTTAQSLHYTDHGSATWIIHRQPTQLHKIIYII